MPSILNTIATQKRIEVEQAKQLKPLSQLEQSPYKPRDFTQTLLNAKAPAIIAEIKKASPSKGIIRPDFDVAQITDAYANNGAACLSVLTDETFFQGQCEYLKIAKDKSNLPILRKDFIIDSYQIHESRALGADCILLIVAMLDDSQLLDFCQIAQALNLSVLVESHTQEELERALVLPTPLMGINNRSLHSFSVDLATSITLSKIIPAEKLIICESGIYTHADIELMQEHGIHTFLVGESLMRERDPGLALALLRGV